MKKRSVLFSLILLLSMAWMTACGGGSQQLVIATGGTGGTYYPLGGGMADHITKNAGVTVTAQATGASAENIRLLRDKKADIAFTQNDIAEYAAAGTNMFQQDGKIDSFQALGALYDETIQIVVSADSNIKSVADLKGKRVSVGAPGSGTEINAQQILEAYGLTFDDTQLQRLSFADSAKAIQDGKLDAAFQTAGTPTAAITELAATTGVKIIPIDNDKIDAIIAKYPYYVKTTVPANTYQTVPEEVTTVSVKSMLLIRSDLDEDLVYKVTKAIFDNTDKLGHAKAKEIKLDSVLSGVSIPIHPGAKKYFDEKGVK
ncbi:TRAP transporter solute receptor, TAXI family [Brevibacillus sp. CF112]|uniref:TAXI family TRAP transporter solute-binding subunit n=1 Tax=Brevibacillus TaxID=55080 RepID=UPI000271D4DF|nr:MULTISPECIES: TAXI family TRAP transporter solute-binding subunit [Brevibacillus]EJL42981.1 TRAP transporter solute receptor, TAXI family [Brevibacillus sp. CF112]MBY0052008.1 TAXI family TRAP transporter solute-binding subunit [Brevibacillus agri]